MDRPLGAAPRRNTTSCAAPTPHLRRARLGFRAVRQPRAAPSPGVAHTEATLGVRTPAWSLQVRRRPRPPFAHRSVVCSSTVTRAGRGLGRSARLASAGVQLEAAAPIYMAVSLPEVKRTAPPAPPRAAPASSPEPAAI
jgi:hypothetical protein